MASDLAYSDIVHGSYKAHSFLEVPGSKEMGIEFHTLSKSYNMAGWRIGFVVGNAKILSALEKLKVMLILVFFATVQRAAITALSEDQSCVKNLTQTYKERLDVFVKGLNEMGWNIDMPKATFYIWAHIPERYSVLTSLDFASLMLRETGEAAAPGTGFGEYGEGYVRFAMVEDKKRLAQAIERLKPFVQIKS